jgi:transposase-like protein
VRKSRFSEAQIVGILKEHDAGVPTAELARKHGVHANTLRLWKATYGGVDTAEFAGLRRSDDPKIIERMRDRSRAASLWLAAHQRASTARRTNA